MTLCRRCELDLTLPGESEADDEEAVIVELGATLATHDGFAQTALRVLGTDGWDNAMRELARGMKAGRLRAEGEAAA